MTSTSTESPASVTYSVMRNGFNILFTIRNDSGAELLKQMEVIESTLTKLHYRPQEKRSFSSGSSYPPKPAAQVVPGRKCPLCNQDLVYASTKDGKKMIKCSTNKYDFAHKQATGCKYIEWLDDAKPTVAPIKDEAYPLPQELPF